ncbi:MAG: type II toxin-antitoxin system VapC family toxin [Thermoanaerobaculia bacterium]|nr:type II toxin-antitoxin system VapC family toxin [Thermoanaerobaculia bacterium]
MIVADTNVIAALILGGERHLEASRAFERDPRWTAPRLWKSEFCDVLASTMRIQGLPFATALEAIERAQSLLVTAPTEPTPEAILRLAEASGASAYDCEYVALADLLDLPLVTADRKLAERFPARAVKLAEFAAAAP